MPARTWSKLSRSISMILRSLTRGSSWAGCPEKSPSTPTTKGSSLSSIAPPISTSYVICTRGGRTRFNFCWMLSFLGIFLSSASGRSDRAPRLSRRTASVGSLQSERLPNRIELGPVLDHVGKPGFQGHLTPGNRALHEVGHRAVRLGAPEVVGDLRQAAQGVLPRLERSGRGRDPGAGSPFLAGGLAGRVRRVGLLD